MHKPSGQAGGLVRCNACSSFGPAVAGRAGSPRWAPRRGACGAYVVRLWFTCGSLAAHLFSHAVQVLFVVVRHVYTFLWFSGGALVHLWLAFVPRLVHLWCTFGLLLVSCVLVAVCFYFSVLVVLLLLVDGC